MADICFLPSNWLWRTNFILSFTGRNVAYFFLLLAGFCLLSLLLAEIFFLPSNWLWRTNFLLSFTGRNVAYFFLLLASFWFLSLLLAETYFLPLLLAGWMETANCPLNWVGLRRRKRSGTWIQNNLFSNLSDSFGLIL